jgi:hypothetical protein
MRRIIAPLMVAAAVCVASPRSDVDARQRGRLSPSELSRDHDGRGALAVLRRDGLLLPFASFDRDSWRVTWPQTFFPRLLEVPLTLDAVPERWWGTKNPDSWRAHLFSGQETPLQLRTPALYRNYCGLERLGLRTDYRSIEELPAGRAEPFPKDGLAIRGGVPLEPIEMVAQSPEWSALAVALTKDVDRVETSTIATVARVRGWRHPFSRSQRQAQPIQIESWYRSPSADGNEGWSVSYVEMVKQYPPRPEDKGCGLETLVSGWLHHRDGKLIKSSELSAKLTYCDRVGATYMLPFGRIRPKDKIYWVFQLSGFESEWFEVAEVRPERARIVLEVLAGACRRFPPR